MVRCEVCGTEDQFKPSDGFYYCKTCNTQSQHAMEEEFVVDFNTQDSTFIPRRKVSSRSKGAKERRNVNQRFRAYRRINIYNDLLRKMVDELMQLGAPARLKVNVMELWFKYIHVMELDHQPYGKLPPFCLQEELVLAAAHIQKSSFDLKKAVYHHRPMRATATNVEQQKFYLGRKLRALRNYQRPKISLLRQASSLNEMMSGMSTFESGGSDAGITSTPTIVNSSASRSSIKFAQDSDVRIDVEPGESSGFGFGDLAGATLDLEEAVCSRHKESESSSLTFRSCSSSRNELSCRSGLTEGLTGTLVPNDDLTTSDFGFGFRDVSADCSALATADESERSAKVDEVDLTSGVAYKMSDYKKQVDAREIHRYAMVILTMNPVVLVCILYLALIRSRIFHIGVVDLFRFVRQKFLSYREPRAVVPDDLLHWRKNLFFKMSLPPIRSLKPSPHDDFLKSVAVLCAFLDIPEVVMPPVRYYIERVGLDLNLPGEIRELAACIAHRLGLQPFWKSKNVQFPYHDISPLPFIELKACAVLLFTLKLRFGIDGLTEQIDSDDARQRNANLKEGDQRFFVVMDWVNQLKRRRHFLLRRGEFCILRGVQFENFYSTACMERDESKRRGGYLF